MDSRNPTYFLNKPARPNLFKRIRAIHIDMKKNNYLGSIVLGLNDALVEMTGAIAGMTLLLSSTKIIALTAALTGFAAALSMTASEYLEVKTDTKNRKNVYKAAAYTGIAYISAVILLVFPFFIITHKFTALAATVIIALCIIGVFTKYSSIIQKTSFPKRFLEMAVISMGIAAITFGIGLLVQKFLL